VKWLRLAIRARFTAQSAAARSAGPRTDFPYPGIGVCRTASSRTPHGHVRRNADAQCSAYDASPEAAIAAIGLHDGPVFVDLDETLYLRNSTEDFIDLARPALLALMVLRVLDAIKPWRWTGGAVTRDNWRIRSIQTLLPWTQGRWLRHVGRLAREYSNQPLVEALQAKADTFVVVTLGFHPVVKPLVAALGFPKARIVASRASSFEDRRRGKLHTAVSELGQETVDSSLFITDSLDDLPLLEKCARPLRTVWPAARFHGALSNVYFPGEYVSRVKHPGERYLWRVIVQEDFAFWLLGSLALAPAPARHVLAIAALVCSFWVIYERGYVDNDWAAEHLEPDGKLSESYWQAPVATPWLPPWIWASALGALAVGLLDWPLFKPWDLAKWLGVLLATYGTFKLYNRIDKRSRVWLYALLQFARGTAYLVLVPATTAAVPAIGSLILARWIAYYIYRTQGGTWPKLPVNLIRLLLFTVLTCVLAVVQGPASLLGWTAPAIFAWNVFRARSDLRGRATQQPRYVRDVD
jgi:phosphoserine phosphatase